MRKPSAQHHLGSAAVQLLREDRSVTGPLFTILLTVGKVGSLGGMAGCEPGAPVCVQGGGLLAQSDFWHFQEVHLCPSLL